LLISTTLYENELNRQYTGGISGLDAVMKKLVEKVTQEHHDDETSRKATLDTYLENATRLLDGMMNALHQQTSALNDEKTVNDALSQEHQGLIMRTITNMVQTSVDGQEDAQNFFIGICSMAVCQ
jgi:hypothetical protein